MASVSLKEAIDLFPEIKPELPRLLEGRTAELIQARAKMERLEDLKLKAMRVHWRNKEYQRAISLEALVDNCPIHQTVRKLQLDVYAYETALGKRDSIAQDEILKAREYPMANLLPSSKRSKGRFHLCPFHNEKSASFHIWKDNRFSCFGCNKHGDTISLVMDLYHLDFKSAVRAINSYGV